MPSVEEIVDRLSGMITKEQAAALSSRGGGCGCGAMSVNDVLGLIDAAATKKPRSDTDSGPFTVNVQDSMYRIFNPVNLASGSRRLSRRSVVLGREGSTLRLGLRGRLSEFIDTAAFERNDVVAVSNAIIDAGRGELVDGKDTVMRRVAPARRDAIVDYSTLVDGLKGIDVLGKIVEIGPVRHADISGKRLAVSDCVLTDLNRSVNASLLGSSAAATSNIRVNDFVKIEFCGTGTGRNGPMLYAGDLSRIVANKIFGKRLAARR
jgi:hypothetical protein